MLFFIGRSCKALPVVALDRSHSQATRFRGSQFRTRRAPESGERSEVRNWSIVQAISAASALTSHHIPASSGFSGGCIRTRFTERDFWRPPALAFSHPSGPNVPWAFWEHPAAGPNVPADGWCDLDRAVAAVPLYYGEIAFRRPFSLSSTQAAG